jgi:2-pyrone-4,6-dicarboxylate lactonase
VSTVTSFEKTPGWLDWCPRPNKPAFRPPPGAVDAHCHVFGPGAEFPYAPQRKYTPCDAGKTDLFALRDHLGFSRNVIVQATCHGADNRAMADACRASDGRARDVATVRRSVTDHELEELHEAGVRGVRFNFLRRLADFTPQEGLLEIAGRIRPLGWHVVVYFEAEDLPELVGLFAALPTLAFGTGAEFEPADEGWGPRPVPRVIGQDREFFAAIQEGREPNASVAQVLPCYEVLHDLEQQLG